MLAPGLSLANAPPLSVPLRYFLTAPLFAAVAGLLLVLGGAPALASRWTPQALAATHLLTLGFITMVMLGALSQLIPVLAGSYVRAPRLVAWIVHPLLCLGTALLAAGLARDARLLGAAAPILAVAFVVFVAAVAEALWRARSRLASVQAMRLALAALAITATLGVVLALARAGFAWPALPRTLVDVHLAWGLAGWVGILVAGVAYQVVPMFQITPEYPRPLRSALAPVVFVAVLCWSAPSLVPALRPLGALGEALAVAALAVFAVQTLLLQQRRRRRTADTTLACWRLGMLALMAAVLLWFAAAMALPLPDNSAVLLGVLVLVGALQSVITGMLYKIVPFLVWLHLRNLGVRWFTMNKALRDRDARRQFRVHAAALAALVLACFAPVLVPVAGALYLFANLYLAWNIFTCLRVYRARRDELPAA